MWKFEQPMCCVRKGRPKQEEKNRFIIASYLIFNNINMQRDTFICLVGCISIKRKMFEILRISIIFKCIYKPIMVWKLRFMNYEGLSGLVGPSFALVEFRVWWARMNISPIKCRNNPKSAQIPFLSLKNFQVLCCFLKIFDKMKPNKLLDASKFFFEKCNRNFGNYVYVD